MTTGLKLLLDSNRGIYIPRFFVTDFSLDEFSGIDPDDIEACKDPDSEGYFDAWANILDHAVHVDAAGNEWRLWQDGDLWFVCDALMSDQEYEDFFGEQRGG